MKYWTIGMIAMGTVPMAFGQAFDFETAPTGTFSPSVTVTNGGNTLTVTTNAAPGLLFVGDPSVPLLGSVSVTGFIGSVTYGNNAAMRFTFATALDAATLAFGDAGGDSDLVAKAEAYDAGDNLLGTVTKPYGTSSAGDTMDLAFNSMKYLILSSTAAGGDAPDSLFWEVKSSTPVPEPATMATVGLGLLALARRKRSR